MNYSDEQNLIVEQIKNNKNVKVDAVPGSGKTASVINIALNADLGIILCLTYSKNLKEDLREKMQLLNIKNLECHSYNSFAVKYFDPKAANKINVPFKHNLKPSRTIANYDLIILDENQDMTDEIHTFFKYALSFFEPKLTCVMGDSDQSIYEFRSADRRYLTLCDKIYDQSKKWVTCKLSLSFRLTDQIGYFINEHLVGYNKIKTQKQGTPVNYIIGDPFNGLIESIFKMILDYLDHGARPSDIFILAPSVKSDNPNHPLSKLEHMLVNRKIPIFIQTNDDTKFEREEIESKVVFCSYHASKGLERKIVFVYGFDHSYFTYYAKDFSPKVCPDTIYVACSRALEHLTVIQSNKSDPFEFIDREKLNNNPNINLIEVNRSYNILLNIQKNPCINLSVAVTDLVKYLPDDLIDNLMEKISIQEIKRKSEIIHTDTIIKFNDIIEKISSLYGTAIPLIYQIRKHGHQLIINHLMTYFSIHEYSEYKTKLIDLKEKLDNDEINNQDLMLLTNYYMMTISKYIHKVEQISDYKWVDDRAIELGLIRLDKEINSLDLTASNYSRKFQEKTIKGAPDGIDKTNKKLWEFKFVDEIKPEHFLQLVVYSWLLDIDPTTYDLLLFNIKTDQIFKIDHIENVEDIIRLLILESYKLRKSVKDDTDFISDNLVNHQINHQINQNFFYPSTIKNKTETKVHDSYILCFDTETTGLNSYDAKIIEIGWIVADEKTQQIIKKENYYIKYDSLTSSEVEQTYKIHKISYETIMNQGLSFAQVFEKFEKDIQEINKLIGHNVKFDIKMIESHCKRYLSRDFTEICGSKKIVCTSKLAKEFLKKTLIYKERYPKTFLDKINRVKAFIKLDDLFEYLFDQPRKQFHRALIDVEDTLSCFFKLV